MNTTDLKQIIADGENEQVDLNAEKTREKTREKIIDYMKDNPKITQEQLAEKTGLSLKGIEWNLKKLKESGILKRIGGRKLGHWVVLIDGY